MERHAGRVAEFCREFAAWHEFSGGSIDARTIRYQTRLQNTVAGKTKVEKQ